MLNSRDLLPAEMKVQDSMYYRSILLFRDCVAGKELIGITKQNKKKIEFNR